MGKDEEFDVSLRVLADLPTKEEEGRTIFRSVRCETKVSNSAFCFFRPVNKAEVQAHSETRRSGRQSNSQVSLCQRLLRSEARSRFQQHSRSGSSCTAGQNRVSQVNASKQTVSGDPRVEGGSLRVSRDHALQPRDHHHLADWNRTQGHMSGRTTMRDSPKGKEDKKASRTDWAKQRRARSLQSEG